MQTTTSKDINEENYIQALSGDLHSNSKLFSISLIIIFTALGTFIGYLYANYERIKHVVGLEGSELDYKFIIIGLAAGFIIGMFISFPISVFFKVQSRSLLIQYEILKEIKSKRNI